LNKQFSIFREASKNIEKSDDKNKKLDAIHLLVGKMKHQTEFYGLAKRKEESAFFESKDANIEYMLHCQKNMIQISPIFSKVKNKSLKINEQKIGTELIKALCQGINLDNNLIQKLFLSNNNLLD
jgi:hydrogenase maturation factor HypF (carbamoyltransferase family)